MSRIGANKLEYNALTTTKKREGRLLSPIGKKKEKKNINIFRFFISCFMLFHPDEIQMGNYIYNNIKQIALQPVSNSSRGLDDESRRE